MKKFDYRLFLKSFLISVLSSLLIFAFVIGVAVVDNEYKSTQDITPLNRIYFNDNNYMLCFSFLGASADINLSGFKSESLFENNAKPLIIGLCVAYGEVKSTVKDLYYWVFYGK